MKQITVHSVTKLCIYPIWLSEKLGVGLFVFKNEAIQATDMGPGMC